MMEELSIAVIKTICDKMMIKVLPSLRKDMLISDRCGIANQQGR
jgi:hypothetical protein